MSEMRREFEDVMRDLGNSAKVDAAGKGVEL
jgi:hypothetical protein